MKWGQQLVAAHAQGAGESGEMIQCQSTPARLQAAQRGDVHRGLAGDRLKCEPTLKAQVTNSAPHQIV